MKFRTAIASATLGTIISIPLLVVGIKSAQTEPESGVRPLTDAEAEAEIEKNRSLEKETVEFQITSSTVQYVEQATTEVVTAEEETTTEASFEAYAFIPLDADMQQAIKDMCDSYEISYDLILAVIKTESEFDVNIIGDNGQAIGLMQIQPQWWQWLADETGLDIWTPIENVQLGIIILTQALNDNNGDLDKALKQYNSGNPEHQSTSYIESIYSNYEWILEQER